MPDPHPGPRQAESPARRLLRRVGGEAASLAALAVCAGGLLGFSAVLEALDGRAGAFDEVVLLALRRPGAPEDPIGPAWLEIAARDVTALGGIPVVMLAGLVALGYLLLARRWNSALLLLLTLPGGLALNTLLKRGFERPRPDLVAHLVEVQTASFPSGHAMLSAVVFLTLGALLAGGAGRGRRRRHRGYVLGVAVLLALLVGASRVYLGVHWPTDVLAGWCLGAAWAMGCWLLLRLARLPWPRQVADPEAAGGQDPRGAGTDARRHAPATRPGA